MLQLEHQSKSHLDSNHRSIRPFSKLLDAGAQSLRPKAGKHPGWTAIPSQFPIESNNKYRLRIKINRVVWSCGAPIKLEWLVMYSQDIRVSNSKSIFI